MPHKKKRKGGSTLFPMRLAALIAMGIGAVRLKNKGGRVKKTKTVKPKKKRKK